MLAVFPSVSVKAGYDPTKDFSPVMLFAKVPFVLTVHPSLGVSTVKELVDKVRAAEQKAGPGLTGLAEAVARSITAQVD